MTNENYTTYWEEWGKKISKLPKAELIEVATRIAKDKERLEELADLRTECRHYLMGVPADEITVEDALESLGYGRDGLDV